MSERLEDLKMKCQSFRNLIPNFFVTLTSFTENSILLALIQRGVDSKIVTVPEIMRLNKKWKKQNIQQVQLML